VRGRNQRIVSQRREAKGDSLTLSQHRASHGNNEKGYRSTRRRPSIWDM